MNNASLQMNSNHIRKKPTTDTEQSLRTLVIPHSDPNTSIDLSDVSILSVGLRRYPNHTNEMLTDDEDDNEVVRISFFSLEIQLDFPRLKQVMKTKTMKMTMKTIFACLPNYVIHC